MSPTEAAEALAKGAKDPYEPPLDAADDVRHLLSTGRVFRQGQLQEHLRLEQWK